MFFDGWLYPVPPSVEAAAVFKSDAFCCAATGKQAAPETSAPAKR
jgi:hypothetical protein